MKTVWFSPLYGGTDQKFKSGLLIIKKLKKYLTNMGWLFAGKIFRMGISMAAGIWVARYLGTTAFGILSFSMAAALLLRPMATFQLEGICVRELVAQPNRKNEILGSAFALSLVAGLLAYFAAITFIHILKPGEPVYYAIVSIAGSGLVFLCFEVFEYGFQAR